MGPRSQCQPRSHKHFTQETVPSEPGFSKSYAPMRIKPLHNPFRDSNASTDNLTVSSHLFQLNDRNRVKFTESVASESEQQETTRKVGRVKYQNNYSQSKNKKNSDHLNLDSQHNVQVIDHHQATEKNKPVIYENKSEQIYRRITFQPENTKTEEIEIAIQTEKQGAIVREERREPTQTKLIESKTIVVPLDQNKQEPLEENLDDSFHVELLRPVVINLKRDNIGSLSNANRVSSKIEVSEQKETRKLIIPKNQEEIGQVNSRIENHSPVVVSSGVRPRRRRKKIFDNDHLDRDTRSNKMMKTPQTHIERSPMNRFLETNRNNSPFLTDDRFDAHQSRDPYPYSYFPSRRRDQSRRQQASHQSRECPHIMCILKSLQIIDKVTGAPTIPTSQTRSKNYQMVCRSIFQTSIELQAVITQTRLGDFYNENLKQKIKELKTETDRIMTIIRQQQFFTNQPENSHLQLNNPLETLKNMYHRVNCLELVHQRYLMWKYKLENLAKQTEDMLKCNDDQLITKIKVISQYIRELKQSQIHSHEIKQNNWPLYKLFNDFLSNEIQKLQGILQWFKEYGQAQRKSMNES